MGEIIAALDVLVHNPLIARPVANAKHELVIGRRSHGYVALYRHVPEIDTVFVLALLSQREAGYSERESSGKAAVPGAGSSEVSHRIDDCPGGR